MYFGITFTKPQIFILFNKYWASMNNESAWAMQEIIFNDSQNGKLTFHITDFSSYYDTFIPARALL